jgi:predicted nucleic acid-binding protein
VRAGYLDTSFLLAILFDETGAAGLRRTLGRYERVFSCDLLTAETLSAAVRERLEVGAVMTMLEAVALVLPHRSLDRELRDVLALGYLRGADAWHVACALFVSGSARSELAFLSRDTAQRRVARRLGFATP